MNANAIYANMRVQYLLMAICPNRESGNGMRENCHQEKNAREKHVTKCNTGIIEKVSDMEVAAFACGCLS